MIFRTSGHSSRRIRKLLQAPPSKSHQKLTSSKLASSTAFNNCPPIAASILSILSIRISHIIQPQMTPPCRSFPASELPLRIQQDASGRRRKLDGAGSVSRKIDLSACELFQMLQYKCEVQRPLTRESPVRCFAVDRLFRRCKDKQGTFTVETTAWEGERARVDNGSEGTKTKEPPRPHQWSSSWHDADEASP